MNRKLFQILSIRHIYMQHIPRLVSKHPQTHQYPIYSSFGTTNGGGMRTIGSSAFGLYQNWKRYGDKIMDQDAVIVSFNRYEAMRK